MPSGPGSWHLVTLDPGNDARYPAWTLRNLLLLAAARWESLHPPKLHLHRAAPRFLGSGQLQPARRQEPALREHDCRSALGMSSGLLSKVLVIVPGFFLEIL